MNTDLQRQENPLQDKLEHSASIDQDLQEPDRLVQSSTLDRRPRGTEEIDETRFKRHAINVLLPGPAESTITQSASGAGTLTAPPPPPPPPPPPRLRWSPC